MASAVVELLVVFCICSSVGSSLVLRPWASRCSSSARASPLASKQLTARGADSAGTDLGNLRIHCFCDSSSPKARLASVNQDGDDGTSVKREGSSIRKQPKYKKKEQQSAAQISGKVQKFNNELIHSVRSRRMTPHQIESTVMKAWHQYQGNKSNMRPNTVSYTVCLDAWAKSISGGSTGRAASTRQRIRPEVAMKRAEAIWHHMEQIQKENGSASDETPNLVTYNTMLSVYAKAGAADKAMGLLGSMKDNENVQAPSPDIISYNNVILSCARSKGMSESSIISAVEGLMDDIQGGTVSSNGESQTADMFTYSAIMEAYVRCNKLRNGAYRAVELLKRLQNHFSSSISNGKTRTKPPNTALLNTCLKACATSGGMQPAKSAEETLQWALSLFQTGQNEEIKPDITSYNIVLNSWARSGDQMAAERAEELLDFMESDAEIVSNVVSYCTVLNVLSKQSRYDPTAPSRAEELLLRMKRRHLKPNARCYTCLIDAYGNSRTEGASDNAMRILRHVENVYSETGDVDMKPTVATYGAVMTALSRSRSKDAADQAESLLHEMERDRRKPRPNVRLYNSVIEAMSKSEKIGASMRAQEILDRVEIMYETGETTGVERSDVQPNLFTYGSCIAAWARSNDYGKSAMAQSILHRMKEKYMSGSNLAVKPNTFHYNYVLRACSDLSIEQEKNQGEEQRNALNIALETYREILDDKNDLKPDSYTYSILIFHQGMLQSYDVSEGEENKNQASI